MSERREPHTQAQVMSGPGHVPGLLPTCQLQVWFGLLGFAWLTTVARTSPVQKKRRVSQAAHKDADEGIVRVKPAGAMSAEADDQST